MFIKAMWGGVGLGEGNFRDERRELQRAGLRGGVG